MARRKNVVIRVCLVSCNFAAPMTDPVNVHLAGNISRWAKISTHLHVWSAKRLVSAELYRYLETVFERGLGDRDYLTNIDHNILPFPVRNNHHSPGVLCLSSESVARTGTPRARSSSGSRTTSSKATSERARPSLRALISQSSKPTSSRASSGTRSQTPPLRCAISSAATTAKPRFM